MSIFSWIGRRVKLTDHAFWATYFGGDTWAGESINPETAMQVSAFWACVRLISQTIGTLPLGVYERQADGSRKARGDHGLYRLVHDQPNADHTAVEFWEGVVACLCLSGNAFAEKAYQGEGTRRRLVAMTLLNPAFMAVVRDENGALSYRYTVSSTGKVREYREDEIFHVRGFGIGGDLGLSPIAYARQSLSANRATERAAASHFANGMRPSGWLVYKGGILEKGQRERARQVLIDPMTGPENAGKTGILEGDFDYRQMSIPPETAQLLETRSFGVEECCRIHGVPPILVGHASPGSTMFGAGVEQVILGWYTLGLRPYLTRIEQAVKRSLIAAEERASLYVEFNIEGLLRADSAARGEFYWKLFQVAAITPNQICDKENFPRFEGGDRHFVNQTMAPLDATGMPAVAAPADAPAPPLQQRKLEVVK